MKKIIISKELGEEIIDFYLTPNSINDVVRKFNLSKGVVSNFLYTQKRYKNKYDNVIRLKQI